MPELRASDIITNSSHIYWNDPLILALSVLAGTRKHSPYRLPILDDNFKVKGVIVGRRILEILLGSRGTSLRSEHGIAHLLRQNVGLFCDEAHNIFHNSTLAIVLARYMAESGVGNISIVDEKTAFRGTVNESAFLLRMRDRFSEVKVSDVMARDVQTVGPEAELLDAARHMTESRVRRLPVVSEGKAEGMLTVTDVLRHILVEERHVDALLYNVEVVDLLTPPVRDVMVREIATIDRDQGLGVAASQILERDVSALLVTSRDGDFEGMIARIDFISGLAKIAGTQALNQLVE